MSQHLRYIAIEGPIGVGKTTLCARISASLGAEQLLEAPEENPFLERFYSDPASNALPAQLCFLLQRARQVDQLRQTDLFAACQVADFLFDKDRIFAALNLQGDEWDLYEEIFRRLSWQAPLPDCVIYLHAPVDVLMGRIRERDRIQERNITADYLESVCRAYSRFFDQYRVAPVISVDASRWDLKHRERDYQSLLHALQSVERDKVAAGQVSSPSVIHL